MHTTRRSTRRPAHDNDLRPQARELRPPRRLRCRRVRRRCVTERHLGDTRVVMLPCEQARDLDATRADGTAAMHLRPMGDCHRDPLNAAAQRTSQVLARDAGHGARGWNSIDSMIGAVSAMTSSKRSSGATTVIASVSTDIPSGRSTR